MGSVIFENGAGIMAMNIEGFILAGGRSSRMGYPKANLQLKGRSLLSIVYTSLAGFCNGQVTVVGKGDFSGENFTAIPDDRLDDQIVEYGGPIIGLLTALAKAKTERIAVAACDMPFVSAELFQFLNSKFEESIDAVIPSSDDERPQPLCGIYRTRECYFAAQRVLAEGKRSIFAILEKIRVKRIRFSELQSLPNSKFYFLNVNTPADLRMAEEIASEVPHLLPRPE
jgi:molybdopterin-guanine dinucleotide biosynthesis protein A